MRYKNLPFFILIFPLLLSWKPALAQTLSKESYTAAQQQLQEIENTKDLSITEKASPGHNFFQFSYGEWLNTSYTDTQDIYHQVIKDPASSILTDDLRLWGNLTFGQHNEIYIRLKDDYSYMRTSSDYAGPGGAGGNNSGPHLDMGYLLLGSRNVQLQIGRQYLSVGSGIAYSDVNDGIKLKEEINNAWILKEFVGQSQPHEYSLDYSMPGWDKYADKRYFFGAEAGYVQIQHLIPYVYYLAQKDHSSPNPSDPAQNFRYNSQYWGAGLTGKYQNLSYWMEIIEETGHDFTDTSNGTLPLEKTPVNAQDVNTGVRYNFQTIFNPTSELGFSYGSGDKNRPSPTNTVGGNTNNTDTNFLYFGNYYGGYALAPRLSNLFIYKIDQSFQPLNNFKIFKNFDIGAKYLIYVKNKSTAGISDVEADLPRSFVGTETDFYIHWIITKHVSLSLRYGDFFPGRAFDPGRRSDSKYYYASLNFAF